MSEDERPVKPDDDRCAACGVELSGYDVGRPVCSACDWLLQQKLVRFLELVDARRARAE